MINYYGTGDAELMIGLPDTSTACDQAAIDALFDTHLQEFVSMLYFAAYNISNAEELNFSSGNFPTIAGPAYASATRNSPVDVELFTNLPFSRRYNPNWTIGEKLFRGRRSLEHFGSGHEPSKRLYDQVFKYFVDLKVVGATATYEVDDDNNVINDSNGDKLISPKKVTRTAIVKTGVLNGAGVAFSYPATAPAGEIATSATNCLKMLPLSGVIIPLTPFAPEAAVVFAMHCIREQLLREDPVSGPYNAFEDFLAFFKSEGFIDESFIKGTLLDPDLVGGSTVLNNLISQITTSVTDATKFDKPKYDAAIAAGKSRSDIVYEILNRYNDRKSGFMNKLANCIYRKFGWRGEPFQAAVIMKGDGSGTNGLLNIRNAGVGIGNYTYRISTAGGTSNVRVSNPTQVDFDYNFKGDKHLHWSAWGFNTSGNNQGGITNLDFTLNGQTYKTRAKNDETGLLNLDNEVFYPQFIFKKKPDGTFLTRLLNTPIKFNPTFKWRKDEWWKTPKEDRFIATYQPNVQTMTLLENGTLEVDFGGSADEVFAVFIAYTTTPSPPPTTVVDFSFVLDLSKTFRDDHFVLLPAVRNVIWQSAADVNNMDNLIAAILERFNDHLKAPFEPMVLINGNGIGLRPRAWVPSETYVKNEDIIVETSTGIFNVYSLIPDSLVAGSSFSLEVSNWRLKTPYYNSASSSGYRMGEKVIFNPDPADVIHSELYEAKEEISAGPGVFDPAKWRRIPIVTTDPEKKHFPPLATAGRSQALKDHHARLRYSFLRVQAIGDTLAFVSSAWVSPIRSRLDRMYRNYNQLDLVNNPPTPPLLNLEDDINALTFYDPNQDTAAGNPNTNSNIPIFPDKEYNLIDLNTTGPVRTNDGRTWGPAMNADYPHDGDDINNSNNDAHPGYDPSAQWFPIYNPLLSNLRAMTLLEEATYRIAARATDLQTLGTINIDERDHIIQVMNRFRESSSFSTVVWNAGARDTVNVNYVEFDRIKIQPTCPESLPADLSCPDFTNGALPNWTHGFGYVDPSDPCSPCP